MEMIATNETSHEVIDCREDEGQFRDSLRANNRKLYWENICSELIDNALEHSAESCKITLEWKRNDLFRAVDNGLGASDLQAFFKPGKSVQTGRASGNSTFGMGLFVCECCLSTPDKPGRLRVATCTGGSEIITGFRSIEKTMSVDKLIVSATDENRRAYDIGYRGTSITFSGCSKPKPSVQQLQIVLDKLARWYATSIESGDLYVSLIRDGVEYAVAAEAIPACEELKTSIVTVDGHEFGVEWGVTKASCKDSGCRLIYGGKYFDESTEPCGTYRVGRFYASIRIPRTIGKESMDILKRSIEHRSLDELFDRCADLFAPELQRSDEMCRQNEDESQSEQIATMLSNAIKKTKAAADISKDDVGDEDIRDFDGRDNDSTGVTPKNSGRRRKGRRGGSENGKIPDAFIVHWTNLGADNGIVLYQHDGRRVTFNLDVPMVNFLRDKKDNFILSTIAAGHIAKDIAGTTKQKELGFGDMEFSWIYRTMMERIYPCELQS